MLAVHLNGTFYCTREALRLMSRVNRGAIVNISSVAGLMGIEVAPHYGAAKAGILGFTRSVAREVASRGIRVNAICPGFIDTPILDPLPPVTRMHRRAPDAARPPRRAARDRRRRAVPRLRRGELRHRPVAVAQRRAAHGLASAWPLGRPVRVTSARVATLQTLVTEEP